MTFRWVCCIALVSCVVSFALSVSFGGRNGSSSGSGIFGSLRLRHGAMGCSTWFFEVVCGVMGSLRGVRSWL